MIAIPTILQTIHEGENLTVCIGSIPAIVAYLIIRSHNLPRCSTHPRTREQRADIPAGGN